jgi:hypothetical protein
MMTAMTLMMQPGDDPIKEVSVDDNVAEDVFEDETKS